MIPVKATAKLEGKAALTFTAEKPGGILPPTRHVRKPPNTSIWCATVLPLTAQLVRYVRSELVVYCASSEAVPPAAVDVVETSRKPAPVL